MASWMVNFHFGSTAANACCLSRHCNFLQFWQVWPVSVLCYLFSQALSPTHSVETTQQDQTHISRTRIADTDTHVINQSHAKSSLADPNIPVGWAVDVGTNCRDIMLNSPPPSPHSPCIYDNNCKSIGLPAQRQQSNTLEYHGDNSIEIAAWDESENVTAADATMAW